MANAFFVRCDCRNRRFTGGKSRFLQEADGRKGIASAADELCGSALILYHTSGGKTSISKGKRTHRIHASIALALGGGKVGTQVGGRCGLREFRTSGMIFVKEYFIQFETENQWFNCKIKLNLQNFFLLTNNVFLFIL